MKSPDKGAIDRRQLIEIRGGLAGADPLPIDRHVGLRLRQRRELAGLTAAEFGAAAGLTERQVRNYERGASRITARRLHEFGQLLGVPASYFFESGASAPPARRGRLPIASMPLESHEAEELLAAFAGIPDRAIRLKLIELTIALASGAAWPGERGPQPPPPSLPDANQCE